MVELGLSAFVRHEVAIMTVPYTIVAATSADAPAIAAIYAHHVLTGTASFEAQPPAVGEIAERMARLYDQGWPWLVAKGSDGAVLGYAYASQFRDRAAYAFTCENSIYLRHDRLGQGIGTVLLAALIEASADCGFRQMIAVIAGTEPASVALHARAGFVEAGSLKAAGRKHGQWIDVLYMQRALGSGDSMPPTREPA